jgi:hypothetical protein
VVHPPGALFDLASLFFKVLKRLVNAVPPLAKSIGTGNDFYPVHESRSFPTELGPPAPNFFARRSIVRSAYSNLSSSVAPFVGQDSKGYYNHESLRPAPKRSHPAKTLAQTKKHGSFLKISSPDPVER